ncbi:hypothetical protein BACCOPRO_03876 [Phocaeicola coprophilus DSM 18228 = JCM 13818]|uniref:Uncharacterized protein n=1 Tax=Phocaeicola coprophilus DSM 18228 = JCM 13818 TaxID=547042 RepID=S0FDF7_9BACT|nr:hypothetical protein BACCOPRO_03876 [Phocaeicola coprophilus DSM 18228 = JCM 13818]
MLSAICRPVTPSLYSRTEPSGKVILIISLCIYPLMNGKNKHFNEEETGRVKKIYHE